MLVINFETPVKNLATGEDRADLRDFDFRVEVRPFALRAPGRVEDGRGRVVDGEAMS
jgi:hypothetical protein